MKQDALVIDLINQGPLLGFFMDTYYPLKRYRTAGHLPAGLYKAEDLYPHYKKILSGKPLLIWGDMSEEDINFIHRKLDRDALALLPVVHSKEQAEAIWTKFKT